MLLICLVYTWDAVTSVKLNISMVRYLRRHLVCTINCLHEHEWWLLMRWSCERSWLTFVFLIKSSLLALTYTKFRRMIWSMIWSCGHRSRFPMCTVTSSKCRETSLGKGWKHTTLWFPGGSIKLLQMLRRNSADHSSDMFTVIRAGCWSQAKPARQ